MPLFIKFSLLIIIAISILPIYPQKLPNLPDPKDLSDKRVTASINSDDLNQIVGIVRQRKWGGLYINLFIEPLPILEISDPKIEYIIDFDRKKITKVLHKNNIIVVVTGSKKRNVTIIYYVSKDNENWVITKKQRIVE